MPRRARTFTDVARPTQRGAVIRMDFQVATRSEASITAVIGTASASKPITKTGNMDEKTSGPPGTGAA